MALKTLSKRNPTNAEGIFYKSIVNENGKEVNKVYLIRYRENFKDKFKTIGKAKEDGISINYCKQKRIEILYKIRQGEESPAILKKEKGNYCF